LMKLRRPIIRMNVSVADLVCFGSEFLWNTFYYAVVANVARKRTLGAASAYLLDFWAISARTARSLSALWLSTYRSPLDVREETGAGSKWSVPGWRPGALQ
jgi:hypothetical protein